jgi:hypothetical protein
MIRIVRGATESESVKSLQRLDGDVCIHCFQTFDHSITTHYCEERLLALQPAAPMPYH